VRTGPWKADKGTFMQEWVKVVVQPLGLAGFALFLVFGLIARAKRNDQRKWLSTAAVGMAFVALIGGMTLAFVHERSQMAAAAAAAAAAAKPAAPQVQSIQTNGSASPVFVGTGPVTFTASQNSTTTSTGTKDPAAAPKPAEEKKP
jgi:hypothetical protein